MNEKSSKNKENKEKNKLEKENKKDENENIKEMGSVISKNKKGNIFCLTIIGQIEGHTVLPSEDKSTKYEHVLPQLILIEEDENIDGLLIILNTVGGDVEAGLAISEMIASMKKPSVSLVLGGGHSIGIPLAVSAKHSFITPSASMTVHPVRMNGMFMGVPQVFYYFEKMQERIVKFVTKNCKVSSKKFHELMFKVGEMFNDVGTILLGEQAVEFGIIDEIGGLSDALDKLYKIIKNSKKENIS
ncbi:MAG: ATP-dependent Clp protease proteolytic subunit [Clostridiales bacterium]|jgi:ATP-dependent protease ClpP protease subunit|nr:ATP-dependent Clp protease proteolytic subunit [Clostridiales bacterium]